MKLLAAANYDPAGAVSKVTTSLIAMTAFDTTNLRLAFTIPSHGMVTVKMTCVHHGSTTTAQVLLGCLEGATVRGRAPVTSNLLGTAVATTRTKLEASFTLTGLTPGAVNWDAAYGVEIVASANGAIKYGGPNNTTTDDAFGGFNFEIWDPAPHPTNFSLLSIDANGRVDVIKVAGTTQTAGDIISRLPAVLVSGRMDASVGAYQSGLAPLQPTTAGRTLDVTATGEAGIDWANIGGPTTAVNLSGTTIKTATDVETDTADIQSRLPAALGANGNIKADIRDIIGTTATAAVPGLLDTNTLRISGDAAAADNAEAFFDNTGFAASASSIGTATTVTNMVTANTIQISGDTTAADNAEAFFDGTGYAGGTIKLDVNAAQISGDATAADNLETMLDGTGGQVLSLKQLNIENSNGPALVAKSTGGAAQTGRGMLIEGFGGADGITINAGSTGGEGVRITGGSAAAGLHIQGGSSGGSGVEISGGSTDGYGVIVQGAATDGTAVLLLGIGAGHGLQAESLGAGKSINAPQDVALPSGDLDDQLQAIDNLIDTEVAAIKAKTDQLTFTNANQVDANVQAVNDTNLIGDGSGTPWGPA